MKMMIEAESGNFVKTLSLLRNKGKRDLVCSYVEHCDVIVNTFAYGMGQVAMWAEESTITGGKGYGK